MSLALFTFGTRLRATQQNEAVLCGTANRVTIRKDALVISLVAMGGEHSGTWGMAVGPLSAAKPKKFRCGDPSMFSLQVAMWDELERHISSHVDKSIGDGNAPQIIVASRKCWDVLAETAGRVSTAHKNPKGLRLARLFLFANERSALAGDPTVIMMADLLSSVYMCGGEATHDSNLQSVMAWINGGENLERNLEEALRDNDCFLDPEKEDAEFAEAFLKMKVLQMKAAANPNLGIRTENAGSYTYKLNGILEQRWRRIREAVKLYEKAKLQDVPEVNSFADIAFRRWEYFLSITAEVEQQEASAGENGENNVAKSTDALMSSTPEVVFRRRGKTRYDSAREGNDKLAERSAHADQWIRTLVWKDDYEQMKAFADGRLVIGKVLSSEEDEISGTSGIIRVLVNHNMLRIRVGDELVPFDRPRGRATVRFLEQQNDGTTIVGISDFVDCHIGDDVGYGPRHPNPLEISTGSARRGKLLRSAGWTQYMYEAVPERITKKVPVDILKKVNDARAKR